MSEERVDWQGKAARLFCYCVYALGAYIALKYLLEAIAPLLVVFCLSAAVSYAAGKVSKKTGIPRGVCAAALLTTIIIAAGLGIFYACRQLLFEISEVLKLSAEEGDIGGSIGLLGGIRLPRALSALGEKYVSDQLRPLLSGVLTSLSGTVSSVLSRFVSNAPSAMLGGALSLIACYYLSIDFERVTLFLLGLLPQAARQRLTVLKDGALSVAFGYLKGYAILFLLTFAEALVGLLLLCPKYAHLWALAVAAVDVLPLVGAGAVLIPWGVMSIINGDIFIGIGLIVLYVIITVVRQIVEPYVLGKGMGIHPLATILAMLVGYRLFGTVGMIIAPVALAVVLRVRGTNKSTR